MTRKILALAAVLLFALPQAHADEASKRAKIEEMLVVTRMDKTMRQMLDIGLAQGQASARKAMSDESLTAADQKIVDEYMAKVQDAVIDTLSWEKLKPAYIDLYASEYTEDQVDGILTFYKSPVGQAMLDKTPELITRSTAIVQARMQDFSPRVQQITEDMKKQLAAAHHNKPPAK